MKIKCILCNLKFTPTKETVKKMLKKPYLIQICATCTNNITERVRNKKR